ncbi:uncharacterized protein LOC121075289 isoform X9 [Cygnus olor]|uniref:uncharacterized protein LOC121075289 isoform X9 n=1 Tax=Cygnus olor TaxID=8869 RepID=UPI001ADDFB74|nr:uncharacterized protein LOC121075289 isoform X9 [Cygnus olor]
MAVAALCAERAGPGRARGAQPPDRGRGGAGAAAGAEHPRSPAVRELQSPRRPLDRHAGAWGPGRAPRSAPRQPPFCRRPERVVPRVLAPRRAGTRSGAADVTGLRPAPSVVRVGQKEALDAGYWLLRVLWYSNSEGQNPIMSVTQVLPSNSLKKNCTRTGPRKHVEAQWSVSTGLGTLILLKGLANKPRMVS